LMSQPNAGPAAARNRGASEAQGNLLLFTDADCAPAPDWIERLSEPFSQPDVVGAKGTYRTRQRALVARFVQLEYERKYARMVREDRIDFIDTYSAAYRRDVFFANDGFDTRFPTASVEDQEFSFRLARKGYRLVFVPQAVVYHLHDVGPLEYALRKFKIGKWKALLLQWHPERAARDSHTPQTLKLQLALAGLICLALAVSLLCMLASPAAPPVSPLCRLASPAAPPVSPLCRLASPAAPPASTTCQLASWAALAAGLTFLASALPFLAAIARKDPAVALVAAFLLLLRALALGLGLLVGFVRFYGEDSGRRAAISGPDRLVKRAVDVTGSLIGLILSVPLLPVVAAAIKLDSPGPILFIHERAGENGRPFRLVKLRTMVAGADEMLPDLVDLASLPSPDFKRGDDPRVTRVGRFLRRTSLDELPQLWNVLKGEMSLVGPRPEETRVVRYYNDWHRQRLAVKPGLTGPMQVNGRADLTLDQRVEVELDYIRHYSLWRDLWLLARTVGVVVSGRGAR